MENVRLTPRDLSGAPTLKFEGNGILVDDATNPTVFPLATSSSSDPTGADPTGTAGGFPAPASTASTSAFSSLPTTAGSAWIGKGTRQHSTSRVAALGAYTSVIKLRGKAAARTVRRSGWLLLGPDGAPVAWLGNSSAPLTASAIYDVSEAQAFARNAGIGYVNLGRMPHEVLVAKVEGIPHFGPRTGAFTNTVADSHQWMLAGLILGGLVTCFPLLGHLMAVAPSLKLLWILLFGFGGLFFGVVASLPATHHYYTHHSSRFLWVLGVSGTLLSAVGTALVVPAARAAIAANATYETALEAYGLWWRVMILGIGFLLFVMPWNARKTVAVFGDRMQPAA